MAGDVDFSLNPASLIPETASHMPGDRLVSRGIAIPGDSSTEHVIINPALRDALVRRRYGAGIASALGRLIQPGDRVLESSAEIGFNACMIAQIGRAERLIACEANPYLLPFMQRVQIMNKTQAVECVNATFIGKAGSVRKYYLRSDFWSSSLDANDGPWVNHADVPVMDLQLILEEEKITVLLCSTTEVANGALSIQNLACVERIFLKPDFPAPERRALYRAQAVMRRMGFTPCSGPSIGCGVFYVKNGPNRRGPILPF